MTENLTSMEVAAVKVTPEILKEAVARKYDIKAEDVSIADISIKPGSKKGDGFACEIAAVTFKATFNGKEVTENFIAKYSVDGVRAELLNRMEVFEQEGSTYLWFVPKLQKLRAAKKMKPLVFPKCYYACSDRHLILLENLKIQGFEVVEKKPQPLTLKAIKMLLKELAAYHASGLHFIQTYPGGMEALKKEQPGTFDMERYIARQTGEFMKQWLPMTVSMFHSGVLVCKKFASEELASRMEAFEATIGNDNDAFKKVYEHHSKFSMVTHGDAWYNNFLFRYNDVDRPDPEDVAIVDLQMTHYSRLGVELAYFFCSSTSAEQRRDHLDSLLELYHQTFNENLSQLSGRDEEHFSLDELKKEYDDFFSFGFIMGYVHAQVLMVDETSSTGFSLESIKDEESTKRMLQEMEAALLAKVEASSDFRQVVIGLAQDAFERNVI